MRLNETITGEDEQFAKLISDNKDKLRGEWDFKTFHKHVHYVLRQSRLSLNADRIASVLTEFFNSLGLTIKLSTVTKSGKYKTRWMRVAQYPNVFLQITALRSGGYGVIFEDKASYIEARLLSNKQKQSENDIVQVRNAALAKLSKKEIEAIRTLGVD